MEQAGGVGSGWNDRSSVSLLSWEETVHFSEEWTDLRGSWLLSHACKSWAAIRYLPGLSSVLAKRVSAHHTGVLLFF